LHSPIKENRSLFSLKMWQIDDDDFCQFESRFGQIDLIAGVAQAAWTVKNRTKSKLKQRLNKTTANLRRKYIRHFACQIFCRDRNFPDNRPFLIVIGNYIAEAIS